MAEYEVLVVDTSVPEIRAPGAGDTYGFPRVISSTVDMQRGTITTAENTFNLAATWNGNVTFTGIKLDVTDTLSGVASRLLRFNVDAGTVFSIGSDGAIDAANANAAHSFTGSVKVGSLLVADFGGNYTKNIIAGNHTSGGETNYATHTHCAGAITGFSGDINFLAGWYFTPNVLTQGSSDTIADVATVIIDEPAITVNTGDTVTNASSLLITGAPSEGANNYAILVDSGDVTLDNGNLRVDGLIKANSQDGAIAYHFYNAGWTSDGSNNRASYFNASGIMTGASGDTVFLTAAMFGSSITAQAVAETIEDVSQLRVEEPGITNSTATITNASTIHVVGAPTEGTNNWAVLVDSGVSSLGTGIYLDETASAAADKTDKGQIWVKSGAPNTLWFTDDAGTDFQLGAGGYNITDNSDANWLTVDASENCTFVGNILANTDASQDIGASGTEFNNVYCETLQETSTIRRKENVAHLDYGLEAVRAMNPVSFNMIGKTETQIGLIAEEINQLIPEVVKYDDDGNPSSMNYGRLVAVLVNAIQELDAKWQS